MMKRRTRGALAAVAAGVIGASVGGSAAFGAGETVYDADYCGGPDGANIPTFSSARTSPTVPSDLEVLLGYIGFFTATNSSGQPINAAALYGPDDHWTNWYESFDIRESLAKLATMRGFLDASRLWDMYLGWFPSATCPAGSDTVRQIDGTCNDLDMPAMGSAGMRFGRNVVPFTAAAHPPATEAELLSPNPRTVSRVLFTREVDSKYDADDIDDVVDEDGPNDGMKTAPFFNLLGTSWVQFQVHDWFSHDENSKTDYYAIPLDADDPFAKKGQTHMYVGKTRADPTRLAHEAILPPSYQNDVTHWWDGSQIYGSDIATSNRLRTFSGGHMKVDSDGLIPAASDGFADTGFRRNWWLGLALLHNLFTQEHNAIADELAAAYPSWTDQQIYDKARMINAALIVKIHTIEWTPAILPNPALEAGMNANWRGLNQYLSPQFPEGVPLEYILPAAYHPYIPLLEPVIFGVAGGKKDLKKNPLTGAPVPFSLTEEFVSVYRMHALVPDKITVYKTKDGKKHGKIKVDKSRDKDARKLTKKHGMGDLLYSFGRGQSGALALRNYPAFLQNLSIPFIGNLDIGAVDVLRDRERGVPRYNEFRRQLWLQPLGSLEELTSDPELLALLKQVYGDDAGAIERVDLLVGTLAEGERPTCYGFGETLFQVFTVMATRRIQADRFLTDDFNASVYTPEGMAWIDNNTMKSVLLRHYPELAQTGLASVTNAFYPWESP